MGWLFCKDWNRKQTIDNCTRNWETVDEYGNLVQSTCIAHCYRGNAFSGVLWTVWERTFTRNGVEGRPTERWIGCDLLKYYRGAPYRDQGWGYKDMEESMGPCYYSCPKKYLDMVPLDQAGTNPEWRRMVQAYHAQKSAKKKSGKFSRFSLMTS